LTAQFRPLDPAIVNETIPAKCALSLLGLMQPRTRLPITELEAPGKRARREADTQSSSAAVISLVR
jgi:hypothetical protein